MIIKPYKRVLMVCIPGFKNTVATLTSGVREIQRRMDYEYASQYGYPWFEIVLRTWNHDWEYACRRWHQELVDDALIIVVAHSWGAGWGWRRFCKYMARAGRRVQQSHLMDPVKHYSIFGSSWNPSNLVALTRWGEMKAPPNTEEVYLHRQLNQTPYGRHVRADLTHQTLWQRVYGSDGVFEKHAPWVSQSQRVYRADVHHNNLDELKEVLDFTEERINEAVKRFLE